MNKNEALSAISKAARIYEIFTYNREYWELFNDCIEDLRFYVENERELNSDIHI